MTVLLAFARSAPGRAALDFAIDEARRRDSELIAFPLDGSIPDPADIDCPRLRIEIPDARSRDVTGDLIDAASRLEAELIVVGMRRRSPTGKLLLGSDAQRIILGARVPVTAVKVQ